MFTIGQFSKITGLSIKTIRLYHEKGLLKPAEVDRFTNYRYFSEHAVERARAISQLRDMQFSLAEIKEILDSFTDEADLIPFLEKQKQVVHERISSLRRIASSIDAILRVESSAARIAAKSTRVEEKVLDEILIASVRWRGAYSETGRYLGLVARNAGRYLRGRPFNLYYETEYKEEGADIESCFPVSQWAGNSEVKTRALPGGRFLSFLHVGPYEELGRSYARVYEHIQRNQLRTGAPFRETYIKGPSMIFRGNPKKYVTEILIPVVPGVPDVDPAAGEASVPSEPQRRQEQ